MTDPNMTLNEYQRTAWNERVFTHSTSDKCDETTFLLLGLCGEAGETANRWKKVLRRIGHYQMPTEEDRAALKDELGDVLWYLSQAAGSLGLTLEEVAAGNLAKLRDRHGKRGSE